MSIVDGVHRQGNVDSWKWNFEIKSSVNFHDSLASFVLPRSSSFYFPPPPPPPPPPLPSPFPVSTQKYSFRRWLLSLAGVCRLFLTIRSVVRRNSSMPLSDWLRRSVEASCSASPKRLPAAELFYEQQRLAIHCNSLKGRNANIKPLYCRCTLQSSITVCVFAHRVPVEMTGYTQRHVTAAFYGHTANSSSGFAWAWHCQMM